MSLWGNSDADEAKPKWLTAAEKKLTFADARGWVFKKSDNCLLYTSDAADD